ncbi:MAG TPA: sulfotransferase [Pararhizobium sp.]|nr:sulfotransferase [Pararhizobium sp.]
MNRALRRRQDKRSRESGRGSGVARMAPQADPHAAAIGEAIRLQQAGRLPEADGLYRKVLARNPGHPAANHFLGLLYHQSSRTEAGLPFLARSIDAEPDSPDFHNNVGTVFKDMGRLDQAIASFRKAVELRPGFAVAWNNLGVAQRQMGRFEEAIESYGKALELQPGYVAARLNLANAEKEAGRLEAAEANYRAALKLKPNDPETNYQLALTQMEHGEIAAAADTFRRTIVLKSRHAEAYLMLASLKRPREMDAEMEAMERLYARPDATEQEKMLLAFALAKSFEDIGRYDEAFAYLKAGNAARRKTFDYSHAAAKAHFDEIKMIFDSSLFERRGDVGCKDRTPIFIVGMPRSGTTLVEQILASHPQVFGPGELSLLQSVAAEAFPAPGGTGFPADLADMDADIFARAGEKYVSGLRVWSKDAERITDKMPGNFMLIGLIRLILPNAKVIHCVRDPRATCLSIFKTYFRSQGHRYGYNLEELADYHNLYTDLMRHWHRVLPGFVTDVRYEELIADQETQSRALVAACGLEWDDNCLSFHKSARQVRTASAAQVRQPIYDSSLELWRRYEEGLKPLLDRLV